MGGDDSEATTEACRNCCRNPRSDARVCRKKESPRGAVPGVAGIRGNVLIVTCRGPSSAVESLDSVAELLPHALMCCAARGTIKLNSLLPIRSTGHFSVLSVILVASWLRFWNIDTENAGGRKVALVPFDKVEQEKPARRSPSMEHGEGPNEKPVTLRNFLLPPPRVGTFKTVTAGSSASSSLVLDPRFAGPQRCSADFALKCAATSAPRPELVIIVTFFQVQDELLLPSPSRPFTFSRKRTALIRARYAVERQHGNSIRFGLEILRAMLSSSLVEK